MPINLKTWWHHLALGALFHKNDKGEITVTDAANQLISVISQVQSYWDAYKSLFAQVISDEGIESIDKVSDELTLIKEDLQQVNTLPDVAEQLQGYRFAEDDKRNDFYHSLISMAAIAGNDGKISLLEGLSFVAAIAAYIKDNS